MNKKVARRAEMIKREKRKKIIFLSVCAVIVVAIILAFIIPRISNDNGTHDSNDNNIMQGGDGSVMQDGYENGEQVSIDIDLTAMSSTMVYAAVLNIMRSPDSHLGQVIRVSGVYHPFFWNETGLYYHYVIVEGQPGCCPQRMEFKRRGDYVFPDDYPPEGAMIEIIGVFGRYEEMGHVFFYLAVDDIVIME